MGDPRTLLELSGALKRYYAEEVQGREGERRGGEEQRRVQWKEQGGETNCGRAASGEVSKGYVG
ncbi:hypothetical protein E2C01_057500 [Portunus trituberculatus]|uniref:Uncharacterized protein n=1 Tax=Portunus trituberculatus TaxID=210409 RepID=A0A5B7GWZ4_PORTR|nr:hypothetical protein [Portunus trituberculatus]